MADIEVTLPDGSCRSFAQPPTAAEVAADVGPGLARALIAARVQGCLVDSSHRIEENASYQALTLKDEDGLAIMRHSCAHLMAQAVQELWPGTQVTIGPVIKDGFYYDFDSSHRFVPEDLPLIEERMRQIAGRKLTISREELERASMRELFAGLGESYKVEIIDDIGDDETLTLYRQGDFVDLCRGPHVPTTASIAAFRLTKISGSYWRGDPARAQLQRIYGTAWPSAKELEGHIQRIEEAEKHDHRALGTRLDLFHFQDEAPGMVFWHAPGWVLYRILEGYMRERLGGRGYDEVHTPQMLDRSLWERSGHWDKYQDMIFTTQSESRDYALKPMNCPGHVQLFNQGLRSYRELPVRFAEFGVVHRNEPSGTLHGLMRARRFTQDDGHVFCTPEQIASEIETLINLMLGVYGDFGFSRIRMGLSTRPQERVGDEKLWDQAEDALRTTLEASGHDWELQPGDGAFYGPKIDFVLQDSIGREWQCGTIQLDFFMPGRLGAHYIDENSDKVTPVMIHRAALGSLERFIGIVLEHFKGELPLWLSPVQVLVLNVSDKFTAAAQGVRDALAAAGVRVRGDFRNERVNYKIREATLMKIPYIIVIGAREAETGEVSVRCRGEDESFSCSLGEFTKGLLAAAEARAIRLYSPQRNLGGDS